MPRRPARQAGLAALALRCNRRARAAWALKALSGPRAIIPRFADNILRH